MASIIAYTYDADVHCPECARESFRGDTTLRHPRGGGLYDTGQADENGVGTSAIDRDGNPVHPVFTTDEHDFTHCCDCGSAL